jgi:trehalose synthase
MQRFDETAALARDVLDGRPVVNVNSTAVGGGVAEMLQTLLSYARGAGVDTRWFVIDGDPEFFAVTKRIHNGLYGSRGDGGMLNKQERAHYEETLARNAEALVERVQPGDVVLLHDPQTAGLAPALSSAGAVVVWRCHVGIEVPNEWSERAWSFLRPFLDDVPAYVFSRKSFAPSWVDPERLYVIAPSIDPFSAKNEPMSERNVRVALGYVGLLDGGAGPPVVPFTRRDGTPGIVERHVDVLQSGPATPADAPVVLQVSRWDSMKDMAGVMRAFVDHVDPTLDAHLILAGPAVHGVADDPEAAQVYDECVAKWRRLPHAARGRVHLACLPMADPDEQAAIVNALQRHASVVCQKSIAEGFGLTVAEAMWKARPIVASAVGGIADQIVDGEHGLLIDDAHDLEAFGSAVEGLLRDPEEAARLAQNARRRAIDDFLGDRHLEQYGLMLARLRKR